MTVGISRLDIPALRAGLGGFCLLFLCMSVFFIANGRIAAGALYFLGTGPIRGFGLTLGLGVMVSFLSAVTVSHIMLRHVSVMPFARKKWLYRVNA